MPHPISVAILAGGKSSRMGTDKSFVRVLGRPLIEDVLAQVSGIGAETIIITNRGDDYRTLGLPLFADVLPDKGALGGIYTALHSSSQPHTLCVACDMPFVVRPLLDYLISLIPEANADAIVPRLNGEAEPFRAICCRKSNRRKLCRGAAMERRNFLKFGAASLAGAHAATSKRYRAAVIGHTGRGDYGHGWDTAWNGFDSIKVVAVADPDEAGREAAMKRCGAAHGYRDYREMLRQEKPDLVSIGPRWLDQRAEMVTAAAQAGAHILLEKPFAASLADADAMVEAVVKNNVKLQVGHQM